MCWRLQVYIEIKDIQLLSVGRVRFVCRFTNILRFVRLASYLPHLNTSACVAHLCT